MFFTVFHEIFLDSSKLALIDLIGVTKTSETVVGLVIRCEPKYVIQWNTLIIIECSI